MFAPLLLALACVPAQDVGHRKISATSGDFVGPLDDTDAFGFAVARLGDLDGDGIDELAVGARQDDDGGPDRGAVWVLFLGPDGRVRREEKISSTSPGMDGALRDGDQFGQALATLGDLDGDGVSELAVGAWLDDDGGADRGAVWILFLDHDAEVHKRTKISQTSGGFSGALDDGDAFAVPLATLDDLDGNGVPELAVGAYLDDDGGPDRGAVWILFLAPDGTVLETVKVSATSGGFTGALDDGDGFGTRVARLDDLDGDGRCELAVGAFLDDDGGPDRGAVWILFLDGRGRVRSHTKLSTTAGGLVGPLDDGDAFGVGLASPGDLEGDGTLELYVGTPRDDDGGPDAGAVWLLSLDAQGLVAGERRIAPGSLGFTGALGPSDAFGIGVAALGDLLGDGNEELAVGAWLDDDGGLNRGALWLLTLCPGGPAASQTTVLGSPPNPAALVAPAPPVWGTTWAPRVEHAAFQPGAVVDFLALGTTVISVPSALGTLLVDPATAQVLSAPAGSPFELPLPATCATLGVVRHVQGASWAPGVGLRLTARLDVVIGAR